MKLWKDIGFEIEVTGDGSPSLRLLQSVDPSKYRGESMHHSGGACAETLLIYGRPAKSLLEKIERPSFLIVGLGLGYIEMTIAREALLLGRSSLDVSLMTSFESVPELRQFFYLWLHGKTDELSSEVVSTYEAVMQSLLQGTSLNKGQIQDFLRPHYQNLDSIQGALSEDAEIPAQYDGIMYDAFSSKTSPHLWEETFLTRLLHVGAQKESLFTTYACRGSLKRALQNAGFEVVVREGFLGKRNSTLGVRSPHKKLF